MPRYDVAMTRFDTARGGSLLLLAFITLAVPSWAQTPNAEEGSLAADGPPNATQKIVEPSDVYARLMFLQSELDQIRFELGKPKPVAMEEIVSEVEPREVRVMASDRSEVRGELYAKVTGPLASSEAGFAVHFTSIPPELAAEFVRLSGPTARDKENT